MQYRVEYSSRALKDLKKLDVYTKRMIKAWIDKNLVNTDNPRRQGKSLVGNYKGHWRYRIGDYRLLCLIEDDELIIVAVSIGHRREVYKR